MDNFQNLDKLIDLALEEDLHKNGDITSEPIFTYQNFTCKLISKDKGVLCGIEVFSKVFQLVDDQVKVILHFRDGSFIAKGDVVAEISGKVASILKAERTALNFLSMLSAVATRTSEFVNESGGVVTVLDTRKTIPGFRLLQKYAVRCGGGSNHRMGLYDMVMIKDNHIDAAGGITAAVTSIKDHWGDRYKIEVETRNISEVREALASGVDRIMLDNMSDSETIEAVRLINGNCETEASGNMTLGRIKQVAATGVNFISIGEITHSIKAFDFSLKVK
jgi:nicotinate-nucleotide pyrophosphorylase (carboxylating)